MPTPKKAAALRYTPGQTAPEVVASGRGLIAEKILAAAAEAGIPVREDEDLAQALGSLDLGSEIPPELYVAVAEAIAWAYRMDARGATKRLR